MRLNSSKGFRTDKLERILNRSIKYEFINKIFRKRKKELLDKHLTIGYNKGKEIFKPDSYY